jgi:hypothetical protein
MGVSVTSSSGLFKNTERYLNKLSRGDYLNNLERYAKEGVAALSKATPIDSAETSTSWDFTIKRSRGSVSITWTNSHLTVDGEPVAILLQYGHATGTGGYVQGRDYINPAMKPVFDKIAANVRKEVKSV